MSISSDMSPDAKEPPIKFDFRREIKDAGEWLVNKGSIQISRIDKNDINKIVCLSEFVLGLKISGLSDENIESYRDHILELIRCLKAKESDLRRKENMRVVAWAVLAIESALDFLNTQKKIFNDSEEANIKNMFRECVGNLKWMADDVKTDEEFSVYDLACALWALSKVNVHKEDVLKRVIDRGIEKLLNSRVEGEGYPFTNKNRVSRISSTAFVLFVLGEILKIHKIDYTNKDIKIKEKYVKENINGSINYLFNNHSSWMREDFEMTNYYPYPFVHFTLAYVISALFIHKVEFRPELIDALSELYDHRKDGGFAMEKGAEPFWYSTFDAIYALRNVEENISLLRGLLNTIEVLKELVDMDKKYKSLVKENTKFKKDMRIKDYELKKRDEENKRLQEKLLEKEKEMLSLSRNVRIPFIHVSLIITTVIAVVSVLIEFNPIAHGMTWLVIAVASILWYLRSKSTRSMYIMYGVLTGVFIGGVISLYIAGKLIWALTLLVGTLGLILFKIAVEALLYDTSKKR